MCERKVLFVKRKSELADSLQSDFHLNVKDQARKGSNSMESPWTDSGSLERSRYHGANPDRLPDIPQDRALVRRVRRSAVH